MLWYFWVLPCALHLAALMALYMVFEIRDMKSSTYRHYAELRGITTRIFWMNSALLILVQHLKMYNDSIFHCLLLVMQTRRLFTNGHKNEKNARNYWCPPLYQHSWHITLFHPSSVISLVWGTTFLFFRVYLKCFIFK